MKIIFAAVVTVALSLFLIPAALAQHHGGFGGPHIGGGGFHRGFGGGQHFMGHGFNGSGMHSGGHGGFHGIGRGFGGYNVYNNGGGFVFVQCITRDAWGNIISIVPGECPYY